MSAFLSCEPGRRDAPTSSGIMSSRFVSAETSMTPGSSARRLERGELAVDQRRRHVVVLAGRRRAARIASGVGRKIDERSAGPTAARRRSR